MGSAVRPAYGAAGLEIRIRRTAILDFAVVGTVGVRPTRARRKGLEAEGAWRGRGGEEMERAMERQKRDRHGIDRTVTETGKTIR